MASRALLLVALAAFLFAGIVRADEAPILSGSALTTEDAVAKTNIIFVGQIESLGQVAPSSIGPPIYPRPKIKVVHYLKGDSDAHIAFAIFSYNERNEVTLKAGNYYVFFLRTLTGTDREQAALFKLLPATDDNIATVNKLIALLPAK